MVDARMEAHVELQLIEHRVQAGITSDMALVMP
jgi:hypothetical protein